MVGTILADYQPKRICMTLKQPKFHDFSLQIHPCEPGGDPLNPLNPKP